MHLHFYHWHNRVELKPQTDLLQARWAAAANFSEELSGEDACSLLRLALFGTFTSEFAERFTEALVAQEPTFPLEENVEVLRVMAAAALYIQMETESAQADAVALGLAAAGFHYDRSHPVCKGLAPRAAEYLASESERMRPTPKIESEYRALRKATEAADWATNPVAPQLLGKAVLELGDTLGRIAEENQFLWWLLSRRSSLLSIRREKLAAKEYALVAAAEAAERVALLPPPPSVESLIGEVIAHCSEASNAAYPLADFISAANIDSLKAAAAGADVGELCPISGLLDVQRGGGKVDGASLAKFGLQPELKVLATEAANQYFRELMFWRALEQLD